MAQIIDIVMKLVVADYVISTVLGIVGLAIFIPIYFYNRKRKRYGRS